MIKKFFLLPLLVFPLSMAAQDDKSKFDIEGNVGVVSRYVWRGQLLSDAANIQPEITFSYGGLSLSGFGSYGLGKNFAEVDWTLSYEWKGLTLMLCDYYNEEESDMSENDYFDFNRSSTAHLIETCLQYELPFEKFPLQLTAGVMIFGDDLNVNQRQNHSTYFEVAYPFQYKDFSLTAFVGGTGNRGCFADEAAIVNTGISVDWPFVLNERYSLGLSTSFVVNPCAGDAFFVAGITF